MDEGVDEVGIQLPQWQIAGRQILTPFSPTISGVGAGRRASELQCSRAVRESGGSEDKQRDRSRTTTAALPSLSATSTSTTSTTTSTTNSTHYRASSAAQTFLPLPIFSPQQPFSFCLERGAPAAMDMTFEG